MAGHSKWANIKHKKAKEDAKRAKIWTKIIREIVVAARMGGGDASDNPRLRMVLDKANGANMTKDVIDRAIKRGAGGGEDDNVEEVRYEGYGPAGVAVMVDCLTNNRNRTVAEVRHAFSKAGGNLGTDGSVSYLFAKQGSMMFAPGADADKIMGIVLESGGDDVVVNDDGSVEVVTSPDAFIAVKEALVAAGLNPDDSEVTMTASTRVDITDKDTAEKVERLIDTLEDLDDVQEVYSNAEIEVEL